MDILGVNRTTSFCADGPHAASGFLRLFASLKNQRAVTFCPVACREVEKLKG